MMRQVKWAAIVTGLVIGSSMIGASDASAATVPAEVQAESQLQPADNASHESQAGGAASAARPAAEPNPLTTDPDLLLYTVVVFLLLLAILGKFAWKPIIMAVDRREKQVTDHLAAARSAQEQAAR